MNNPQFKYKGSSYNLNLNEVRKWSKQAQDSFAFVQDKKFFVKRFENEPKAHSYLKSNLGKTHIGMPEILYYGFHEEMKEWVLVLESIPQSSTITVLYTNSCLTLDFPKLLLNLYQSVKSISENDCWHTDICFRNIIVSADSKRSGYFLIDIDSIIPLTEDLRNVIDREFYQFVGAYRKHTGDLIVTGEQYNLLQLLYMPIPLITFNKLGSEGIVNSYISTAKYQNAIDICGTKVVQNLASYFVLIKNNEFGINEINSYLTEIKPFLYRSQELLVTTDYRNCNVELSKKIKTFYSNLNLELKNDQEEIVKVPEKANPSISFVANGSDKLKIIEGESILLEITKENIPIAFLSWDDNKIDISKDYFSKKIEPKTNTNFKLVAGDFERVVKVIVESTKVQPKILSVSVNGVSKKSQYLSKGDPYFLSWVINDASGVKLDGKKLGVKTNNLNLTFEQSHIHKIVPYHENNGKITFGKGLEVELILKEKRKKRRADTAKNANKEKGKSEHKHKPTLPKISRLFIDNKENTIVRFKKPKNVTIRWNLEHSDGIKIGRMSYSDDQEKAVIKVSKTEDLMCVPYRLDSKKKMYGESRIISVRLMKPAKDKGTIVAISPPSAKRPFINEVVDLIIEPPVLMFIAGIVLGFLFSPWIFIVPVLIVVWFIF